MLLCKYFITPAGCGRGSLCQYSHDSDTTTNALAHMSLLDLNNENKPPIQRLRPTSQKLIACKYFAKGLCQKGDDCLFNHEIKMASLHSQICHFFAKGKCIQGDDCRFLHTLGALGNDSTKRTASHDQVTGSIQQVPQAAINTPSATMTVAPAIIKNYV